MPTYFARTHVDAAGVCHKQVLVDHLRAVASITSERSSRFGLPLCGRIVGLGHDIGKFSADFQDRLNGSSKPADHSSAGAEFVYAEIMRLAEAKNDKLLQYFAQMLAGIIASHHHGSLHDYDTDFKSRIAGRDRENAPGNHFSHVDLNAASPILTEIKGIIESADFLAELRDVQARILKLSKPKPNNLRAQSMFYMSLIAKLLFSCLIEGDHQDSGDAFDSSRRDFRSREKPDWAVLQSRLDSRLQQFSVRNSIDEKRAEISQKCYDFAANAPGSYTLTVPTGGGKTLASLRYALEHARIHDMERIVFVVPFTTIIEQNASVVRSILEPVGTPRGSVLLEHHSNAVVPNNNEESQERDAWKLSKENWDAPIVYTTSVQLLNAMYEKGSKSARRMHALSRAVVVVDEAQALPIKCACPFTMAVNALTSLCGSTFVMSSATQPNLDTLHADYGVQLANDPEIMGSPAEVHDLFTAFTRVSVSYNDKTAENKDYSEEDVAELVVQELDQAFSVLVICNTKSAARKIYEFLRSPSWDTFHLSTNMCPKHRKDILARVRDQLDDLRSDKEGTRKLVCVSTQLIEAGVDVDFAVVVRALAGLDSIAQAAGRCNRNGLRETGRVVVVPVASDVRNLRCLETIAEGRNIAGNLLLTAGRRNADLLGLDNIREYFTQYSTKFRDEMRYPLEGGSTNIMAALRWDIDQGRQFSTVASQFKVIPDDTTPILTPYARGTALWSLIQRAYRKDPRAAPYYLYADLRQHQVSVRDNMLEKLVRENAIEELDFQGETLYYLKTTSCYHEAYGIQTTEETDAII